VATVAGEVQLVVGLHANTAKTVFKAACLPATIAPGMCEVQLGMAEITAGQPGQLRFWTADRWESASSKLACASIPSHPRHEPAAYFAFHALSFAALSARLRTGLQNPTEHTHVAATLDADSSLTDIADQHMTHLCRWRRFGNRVSNPLSQAAFTAEGTGPGRLTAAIVQCSDAELAVNYSADVAGRYSLAIRCRATGEVRDGEGAQVTHQYVRISASRVPQTGSGNWQGSGRVRRSAT